MTVFANQIANFSCITGHPLAYWKVNETEVTKLSSTHQPDVRIHNASTEGIHLFTLSILARLSYNMTRIECVVGDETQMASLKIQGLLDYYHMQFVFIKITRFVGTSK